MLMLVTGCAGFIGSHLVDSFLASGHRVIGVDNLTRGSLQNLKPALTNNRFSFHDVDLANREDVLAKLDPVMKALAERVDTVWHLAANSDIPAGVADANVDLKDTFLTTFQTLELMRRNDMKKLAFASTSAVYGDHPEILVETFGPLLPISNYGAMKLASEALISAATESYLERSWIFRFPNVVGSRGTHGIIYDLLGKLQKDRSALEVLGDGKQRKPYLHVSELVEAILFIHANATEKVSLFNIGPEDEGAEVSVIAKAVVDVTGLQTPLCYTGGPRGWVGDVPRFSYSVEKLGKLGWRPKNSSADAISLAAQELADERGMLRCKP